MYYGENPVHGTISFDSIGWAWVTLFQCVTMEGWVDVMYMEMASNPNPNPIPKPLTPKPYP